IITTQKILEGVDSVQEGFPMRKWSIEVHLLDQQGQISSDNIFDKVTYHLHPTFVNPTRVIKKPPFKIEEQGWGEFELFVVLTLLDKSGDRKIPHDLNFQSEYYEVDHKIKIPLSKSANLRRILVGDSSLGSGASGEDSGKRKAASAAISSPASDSTKTKKAKLNNGAATTSIKGNIDLEKLAENITKLGEDDLLGIVQMVTDNRTAEMNIENKIEEGEFTMDLYTLPDQLLKSMWDYVKKRIN
ncbi:hypothetical protein WICPIJ_001776, partial [Wickerhamomyces pijperi]